MRTNLLLSTRRAAGQRSTVALLAAWTLALAIGVVGPAQGEPILSRNFDQRLDLTEHVGQPFFTTFALPAIGIDQEIDVEAAKLITILPPADIIAILGAFDPRIPERLYRDYRNGQAGFIAAVDQVAGTTVSPGTFRDLLRPITRPLATSTAIAGRTNGQTSGLSLLTSGSGTLILLTDNDYFYNVGYFDNDRSTGRSYAVSGARLLLDPSDNDYLVELHNALVPAAVDPDVFYRTLLDILISTDTRDFELLAEQGQVVLTDFLAIYTAELERHEMTGMSATTAPWEIDLAEVTFLANYGAVSGMVISSGQFVEGTTAAYNRGGVGSTRSDFTKLSRLITAFFLQPSEEPALIESLIALTPITDTAKAASVEGNVIRRILTYLNIPEAQAAITANRDDLLQGTMALLAAMRSSAGEITSFIQTCLSPSAPTACPAR